MDRLGGSVSVPKAVSPPSPSATAVQDLAGVRRILLSAQRLGLRWRESADDSALAAEAGSNSGVEVEVTRPFSEASLVPSTAKEFGKQMDNHLHHPAL